MPIMPIQIQTQQSTKMNPMEKVLMGLAIADKVLNLGLAYPRYKAEQKAEKREAARDIWSRGMQEETQRMQREEHQLKLAAERDRQTLLKERNDPESRISKLRQEMIGKINPNLMGMVTGKSAEEIDQIWPQVSKIADQEYLSREKERERQHDLQVEAIRQLITNSNTRASEEGKRAVPGLGGQIAATEKDKNDLIEALDTYKGMISKVKIMQELRDKYRGGVWGVETLFSKEKRDDLDKGKIAARELIIDLKKLAAVRGLSEDTIKAFEDLIPGDPLAALEDWPILTSNVTSKLDRLRGRIEGDFINAVENRGLEAKPYLIKIGTAVVERVNPKTGQVERRIIGRERVPEAEQYGFQEVR